MLALLLHQAKAYFCSEAADVKQLVPHYAEPLLADPNPGLRRGYALALGTLPEPQLRRSMPQAIDALVSASTMEEDVESRDPETRRNAIKALVEL